jgi:hypothetical protein
MGESLVDVDVIMHANQERSIFISKNGDPSCGFWLSKVGIDVYRDRKDKTGRTYVVTMPLSQAKKLKLLEDE